MLSDNFFDTIASGINLKESTLTIPANSDTSNSLKLIGSAPLKLIVPANFLGSKIGFLISTNNIDFYEYYNAVGNPIFCQVAPSRVVGLSPADLLGVKYLKLKSDAAEAGVDIGIISMDIK